MPLTGEEVLITSNGTLYGTPTVAAGRLSGSSISSGRVAQLTITFANMIASQPESGTVKQRMKSAFRKIYDFFLVAQDNPDDCLCV